MSTGGYRPGNAELAWIAREIGTLSQPAPPKRRATASELQDQLTIQRDADGSYHLDRSDIDLLRGFAAADAFVRVLDSNGRVVYATSSRPLGPPVEGIVDVGDIRVVSRQIVAAGLESPGDFGGYFNPLPRPVAQPIGFVQYGKLENSVQTTINRVRVFLAFGVLGGTLLAFLGGLLVAKRAMRPIASSLGRGERTAAGGPCCPCACSCVAS